MGAMAPVQFPHSQNRIALSAAVEEVRRARRDLIWYTTRLFPDYQVAAIHERIAQMALKAITQPGYRGLVILPPRFGKSELLSANMPGWALGIRPDMHIIGTSHTQELANDFSRQARNKVTHPDYPWDDVKITGDAGAVKQWEIESPRGRRRGRYYAVGVGGAPAGKGADLLIVDDAVANQEDADSPTMREKTWRWFTTDIRSRLNPRASMFVIGTRWHHDDLIGRILRENHALGRWEVLHMPAILPDGTSLDPQRWPIQELVTKRDETPARVWQSLYQGSPTEEEGALIKSEWIGRYTTVPPGVQYLIQSWDTAYKVDDPAKKRQGRPIHDFSVCHTYAVTVYGLYMVGHLRKQLEFPELRAAAIAQYEAFKPRYVLIEDKASGQSLIQELHRTTRIPAVAFPVAKGESKIKRVVDITPHLETKRVHLPDWAPWADDVLNEWIAFPLGEHDDEVDAMSQAVLREFGSLDTPPAKVESYLPDPDEDRQEERIPWGIERY